MKVKIKEKLKKDGNKIVIFLILILVILLGILVGASLSKYQSIITGKIYTKIAKPILEIRREESILVTATSQKNSYTFEVRNYNEEESNGKSQININEVDMNYYIEIVSNTDEAIQFELFREETKIPLKNNKTEEMILPKDQKQAHIYHLEIVYDKTKGTLEKDINEDVEIKIHSIQKA